MGYNTRYHLDLDFPSEEEIVKELRHQSEEAAFCLNPYGDTDQDGRWYEHEKEMQALSAKHPTVLFTLHGAGEDRDDRWRKYFKAGKVQVAKAQIAFEPFDESKATDLGVSRDGDVV